MARSVARLALSLLVLVASLATATAQFDPPRASARAPAVAAIYPEPHVTYTTPSFTSGRADFTSYAEFMAFLAMATDGVAHAALRAMGISQEGRAIAAAIFSASSTATSRPVARRRL